MTNRQAVGFMLLASKEVGLTKEQVEALVSEMYNLLDVNTNAEAETKGFNWYQEIQEQ